MPEYISKNGEWKLKAPEGTEAKLTITIKEIPPTYEEMDVNRDGVVDEKDATIASKIMTAMKKPRGRKKQ